MAQADPLQVYATAIAQQSVVDIKRKNAYFTTNRPFDEVKNIGSLVFKQ